MVGERDEAPNSFEAVCEVDIFHERNIRKPADPLEDLASDEDRLVACGDAAPPGTPVHQASDEMSHAAIGIEANVEPSADGRGSKQCLEEGLSCIEWKLGIGMQEQQHITLTDGRAGVQLARAPLGCRQQANGTGG